MTAAQPVERVELPAAPVCPTWCTEPHLQDWDVWVGGTARRCHCELPAGNDVDGNPVSVVLTRHAFADPGTDMEICKPEIEVVASSRLDAHNARALCLALAHAAVTVEHG